jgi:hypothetical protein
MESRSSAPGDSNWTRTRTFMAISPSDNGTFIHAVLSYLLAVTIARRRDPEKLSSLL